MLLKNWLLTRRDRLLGSPVFHQSVLRFPLFRWIARRRARELFDITAGFVYSQVLAACVELDLFERLAEGPRTSAQLAAACDLPVDGLERLLRAAAELRLLQRWGADSWRLGDLGAASRGSPGIAAMVRHHHLLYSDLAEPLSLLRDRSQSALSQYWAYASRPGLSEAENAQRYSELMAQSQSFVADDVLAHCSLEGRRELLDVGGGSGVFAAEALRRFAGLRARVFDLPDVAVLADERFAQEGLEERGSALGGDMFLDALPRGADVISLIRILHDHDDDRVMGLLKAARRAMEPDGLLLIAEPLSETAAAPGVGAYFHLYLWAMGSGQPRSLARIREMLEAAGFADVRERGSYQPLLVRVLTARPAATP
ncbi:methyltransferase [Congregibacter litoralis]|uniref:Hydroxyneurosporene-O-methyltransferase n=1 Tax=Congregibacter litoralis KT71 TaxID=314285 RepID=A4ACR4_9GAMM|nr:methyltransferase [Congregibacter litoralis]EAQ96278.1 hydroxyneurosporene-O-methyltransferase [Congregibacter litoralis KT71]